MGQPSENQSTRDDLFLAVRAIAENIGRAEVSTSFTSRLLCYQKDATLFGMKNLSQEQASQQMRALLNEKQWRQYLAVEAKQRGSTDLVAREAGVSVHTVKRGLAELEAGESYQPGERVRKKGGGKQKLVETDAMRLPDLEQELEPKGDPMSLVQWTSTSLAHAGGSADGQGTPHQKVGPGRDLA